MKVSSLNCMKIQRIMHFLAQFHCCCDKFLLCSSDFKCFVSQKQWIEVKNVYFIPWHFTSLLLTTLIILFIIVIYRLLFFSSSRLLFRLVIAVQKNTWNSFFLLSVLHRLHIPRYIMKIPNLYEEKSTEFSSIGRKVYDDIFCECLPFSVWNCIHFSCKLSYLCR